MVRQAHPRQHVTSELPLTVTLERQAVAPPVVGPPGGTGLVGGVALGAQAPEALAGRGEPAELTVLVDRVDNPVDTSILSKSNKRKLRCYVHCSSKGPGLQGARR